MDPIESYKGYFSFSNIALVIIYFSCLSFSNNTFAQVETTKLYQNPVIQNIQNIHANRDYKTAEKLADEAMVKFLKEKNHKDYCEAIFLKAKVVMHSYRVEESLIWYDSCANYAKKHNLNFHYSTALGASAEILNYQNRSDEALEKCWEFLKLGHQSWENLSLIYQDISIAYVAKGMIDSANYYTKYRFENDSINQCKYLYRSYKDMGTMYANNGKNKKAVQYFLKSLESTPGAENGRKMAALSSLSNVFFQMNDLKKAEEYANRMKDLSEKNKFKSTRARAIFKLGNIAIARSEFNNAIAHYNEAMEHFKNSKNKKWKIEGLLGLARCHLELNKIEVAKKEINEVETLVIPSDNDNLKLKYYIVESLYFLKTKNYSASLDFLKKAKAEAIAQKNLFRKRDISKIFANYYKATKQDNLAFSSLENYHFLNDSLRQIQQAYIINDLDSKYKKAEQELAIQTLAAEKSLMNHKLKRRNIAIIIGSILLGLFSFLSFVIYKLYKRNKEKTIALSEKNELLTQALDDKNFLLKEIHHRVKNNLQIVSSLLSLQARNVEDSVALEALKEGQSRVRSMALIHQNLYQDDDLIGVETKSYIEKLSEGLFHSYKIDHDKIQLNTDIENIKLDVNTIIPLGLIINELISNSLKYAFNGKENGNIQLSLKKENENLIFSIEDNGNGLPESFSIEKSKTLGFRLIKAFSQKLNADLSIKSLNGTKISLKIPNIAA